MVRGVLQADQPSRIGMIGQVFGQAAIVGAEELLERRAGWQLVPGVRLGTEGVVVGRHLSRAASQAVRGTGSGDLLAVTCHGARWHGRWFRGSLQSSSS